MEILPILSRVAFFHLFLKLSNTPFFRQKDSKFIAYRQFRKSKLVVIQAYKQNNMGVIEVTDFGRGMSLWQQLLVKYFHITTKPHGHGIGLDYVNQATKMFGGQVKISSGGGSTTVKVSYPWSGNIYPKPRTVLISNDSPKATRNLLI